MKTKIVRFIAAAAAISTGLTSMSAVAQTAPAGSCQIFRDFDYKGPSGKVVGNQKSGDAVIFTDKDKAPAALVAFLSGKVGYRVWYDKTWNKNLSSVKVGKGCVAELHNRLDMQQGSVFPFKTYKSDTANIGAAENDKAQMVICRCPK